MTICDLTIARATGSPPRDRSVGAWELQDPIVIHVGHVHRPVGGHGDAPGIVELSVAGAPGPPLRDKVAVAVEFLAALVIRVGHVNIAAGRDGHAERIIELPVPAAFASQARDELSAAFELPDAVLVRIHDVDCAVRAGRRAGGLLNGHHRSFGRKCSNLPEPAAAPRTDTFSVPLSMQVCPFASAESAVIPSVFR